MNTTIVSVIGAAVVWAAIGLASWRRIDFGSRRTPLFVYLIGVAVVWAVVLALGWVIGGSERLNLLAMVCFGFAVGMLAMYIAVHVYKT